MIRVLAVLVLVDLIGLTVVAGVILLAAAAWQAVWP
jgi:hypothetical protein